MCVCARPSERGGARARHSEGAATRGTFRAQAGNIQRGQPQPGPEHSELHQRTRMELFPRESTSQTSCQNLTGLHQRLKVEKLDLR